MTDAPNASTTTSAASSSGPRRFLFDRALVDRMDRALLCRILAPHADALAAIGLSLVDLAATGQNDRSLVEKLFNAAHGPTPPFPAEVRALFVTLAPFATVTAQAALLRRDAASPTPRFLHARLPPANLAAMIHLEAPHLFDEVRVATDTESADTFTDFLPASRRPLVVTPEALAAFEKVLKAWLVLRGQTDMCRVRVTETTSEILLVIEFALPATSFDMVDDKLDLVQVNGNTADRALAVFDKETCGLGVHGGVSMKDALRRFVGQCFFGSAEHFTVGAVYTLEPLRDLDVALDPNGIPGLESIQLRDIVLVNPDQSIRHYSWSQGDLRDSNDGAELRAALALKTVIQSAKLYLKIEGRTRPTAVTLTANRKKYLRRAGDVERVLDELLLSRGIIQLPTRDATAANRDAIAAATDAIATPTDAAAPRPKATNASLGETG